MPAGDPQLFTFNPSWSATDFQLAHATTPNDSGPLAPGAYSIVENAQTGWTPTSTVCTSSIGDTETAGSLELDAGETITCVFTNTKQGSIITDKVTVPAGDPQLFTFNPSWSATDFQLAHATTPNDSGPLAPGAYSIVENAQTGWTPTSTVCTSSIGDTETAGSLELDAGETITCVFTNTKQGSIITDKVTVPAGDPQPFTFNPSWSATDFQLAHATTPNDSGPLAPGAYSIVENAQTGWTPTSTVCTSSIGDTETAGSLELDAGETITCVFTNTKQGSIITDKVTVPAGDPQPFTFNPSWSATDFQLAHATTPNDSGPLAPGAYSIVENAQTGWTPTSTVCTSSIGDTETAGSLELDAGETITCVFTNTKQGSIITDKVTVPAGDPQPFTFNPSWSATDFQLAHATTPNDSGPLAPGAYSIVENAQTGWTPTSTVCTSSIGDTETAGSLELDAGETITCVFTNTKQGSIITDKVTVPAGDPQLFTFNPSWSATDFQLAHATTPNDSGPLAPGAYSIVENAQTGWTPTSTVCTSSIGDTETAGSLELDAGETITCVFTNTKQGSITIVKNAFGGDGTFTYDSEPVLPAPSNDEGEFSIATAGGTGQALFSNLAPGTYMVAELALPADWDFTSLTCSDQGTEPGQSTVSGDVATINLQAGESVTCTYTNTKRGTIELKKDWVGTPGSVTLNIGTSKGASDVGTGTANGDDGTTGPETVTPGKYYLSEVGDLSEFVTSDLTCTGALAGPVKEGDATNWSIVVGPGEPVVCTFTNSLQKLTLDKTVSQPPAFDGTYWVVEYEVDVANVGALATTYDLTDVPSFGPNVTVANVAVSATTPVVNIGDYDWVTPALIVNDQAIGVGITHTYTLTVQFSVAGTATSADLDCAKGTDQSGTGTLNTATATFNGRDIDASDCAPVPKVTIDKTVTKAPAFAAGFWTVEYEIDVVNVGPIATTYDLVDVPTFGPNVTVENVAITSSRMSVPVNIGDYDWVTPALIVDDESSDVGDTDTFTVTVTFSVAGTATSSDLDCVKGTDQSGTGTLNTATATFNGRDIDASDCAPVPKVTIDKTVTKAPAFAAGFWTVEYEIDVVNVGPIATTYDLVDVPTFGPNVTVENVAITSSRMSVPVNIGDYDWVTPALIVDDESSDVGDTDTFTVTVTFSVAGTATSSDLDCVKGTDQSGTGTLNTATATFNGRDIDACDCAPVPKVTIDKTVKTAPSFAAGFWTVVYDVKVANVGPIETTYDLTDTPTFGAGTTVTNIAVSATTPVVNKNPYTAGSLIVDDQSIGVGVTHTFTVTVTFSVAGTATSATLDCQLVSGETGTGTLNTAIAAFSGNTIKDIDCAPVPKVTIDKTVKTAPSFAAGFWTVVYDVKVANVGPIETTYDLTDTPTFGAGTTVTNIAVSATTPVVNKNPYTAGSLIVDDQSIGVGVTHTFTVTVTFSVAGTATSATLDCQLVSGETGTGTLNTATAAFNGNTIKDIDCAPVPKVTIDKTVKTAPSFAAGFWTVVYDVKVANVGPIETTYDLTDTPTFGAGTTVTNIAVSATTPVVNKNPYTAGSLIVDDQSIGVGVTHTFTVTVTFSVAVDITEEAADCTIQGTETGTGALNTATAIYSGGTVTDDACDAVPFGGGSGGGGGGGGGDQPPTDTLLPTGTASIAGGPLGGTTGWILWILLTAAVILSGGWVIRRVRFSEV